VSSPRGVPTAVTRAVGSRSATASPTANAGSMWPAVPPPTTNTEGPSLRWALIAVDLAVSGRTGRSPAGWARACRATVGRRSPGRDAPLGGDPPPARGRGGRCARSRGWLPDDAHGRRPPGRASTRTQGAPRRPGRIAHGGTAGPPGPPPGAGPDRTGSRPRGGRRAPRSDGRPRSIGRGRRPPGPGAPDRRGAGPGGRTTAADGGPAS